MNTNIRKQPGFRKNTSLGERMKTYEEVTTNTSLVPRLPIYVRIDGRSFHTFCRGLKKPFDMDFVNTMKETTRYLVEKTNAMVGYVQSDEISLVYQDDSKIPFETRLFKLQSVLASMATSAFILNGLKTSLKDRIEKMYPSFDCRVLNLPNQNEAANMILFRERDCVKNSITLVALSKFSDKQLYKKNGNEKIEMLKEVGVDYYKDIPYDLQRGSYFRREVYQKILTPEEIERIPENQRRYDENGNIVVTRSHVIQFNLGSPLENIENKAGVLFNKEEAIIKGETENEG